MKGAAVPLQSKLAVFRACEALSCPLSVYDYAYLLFGVAFLGIGWALIRRGERQQMGRSGVPHPQPA